MKFKTILTTFAALMLSANIAFAGGNYIVNTNSANLLLRSGAGSNYSIKARMPKGAQVYVNYVNGAWANVTYNGITGFASAQYLKPYNPAPVPAPAPSNNIENIKNRMWNLANNTAGFKIGTRYTGSSQCRGFANKVYQNMFNVSAITGYTSDNYGASSYPGSYIVGSAKNFASNDINAVRSLFWKAQPGAFVQMGRRYKLNSSKNAPAPHSAIAYNILGDGVEFFEANMDGKNTIQVKKYTWSWLADYYKGFTLYMPNSYRLK